MAAFNGKPYRVVITYIDGEVLNADYHTLKRADRCAWATSYGQRIDRILVTNLRTGERIRTYGRFGAVLEER